MQFFFFKSSPSLLCLSVLCAGEVQRTYSSLQTHLHCDALAPDNQDWLRYHELGRQSYKTGKCKKLASWLNRPWYNNALFIHPSISYIPPPPLLQMEKDETVGESSPHIANIGRLVEVSPMTFTDLTACIRIPRKWGGGWVHGKLNWNSK